MGWSIPLYDLKMLLTGPGALQPPYSQLYNTNGTHKAVTSDVTDVISYTSADLRL